MSPVLWPTLGRCCFDGECFDGECLARPVDFDRDKSTAAASKTSLLTTLIEVYDR